MTEMVTVESTGNNIEPQAQQAHDMCSDLNSAQDLTGGMTKIVPSDVDVSAVGPKKKKASYLRPSLSC